MCILIPLSKAKLFVYIISIPQCYSEIQAVTGTTNKGFQFGKQ